MYALSKNLDYGIYILTTLDQNQVIVEMVKQNEDEIMI